MSLYYFDSSAVVKYYVKEKGSIWTTSILSSNTSNTIYLARIASVEVTSALVRQVGESQSI